MVDNSRGGLFPVNVDRVRESLVSLADDIEPIATGECDDCSQYYAWRYRLDAGVQLNRLRAALNNGELDLADCDLATLGLLRRIWAELEDLDYGSHCDSPSIYCGPLFLPGELSSLDDGSRIRGADETYDYVAELRVNLPQSAIDDAQSDLKPETDDAVSDRIAQLARRAIQQLDEPRLTTKRERWYELPQELRRLAAQVGSPRNNNQESPDLLTRFITKGEAAKMLDCPLGHSNPHKWLNELIEKGPDNGGIHRPVGSGQQWRFYLSDFRAKLRDGLRERA
jgi:hypothetical protein